MHQYIRDYFKLLRFTRGYRGVLAWAAACMACSTIFEGVSLSMIAPLTDKVINNKAVVVPGNLPPFLVTVIERINAYDQMELFKLIVLFLPLLFFFKSLFMFLQSYLMNIVGEGAVRRVRDVLYAKFQELSLDFYGSRRGGELISRITNDVPFVANAISYGLTDLIYASMRAVFFGFIAFSLAFKISWQLPIFAFIIFPAIMFPVVRIGKRIKKFSTVAQKRMADLNSHLAETIQGVYIVKVFSRENYELERFKKINYEYYKFMLKNIKRMVVISPLNELIGGLGGVAMFWIVGREVVAGRVSFGVFALFLTALLMILRPIKKLSNVHAINQRALAASQRIYDILDIAPRIKDKDSARDISVFASEISFNNVSFAYENDNFVLNDIDFKVKRGEVVALVGHSGAGKSTLAGLLPRLYDPVRGSIAIDGVDIRDLKLQSLRSMISVVSQEMVLFNASVRDNIAYGRMDASFEDIKEAARRAHAFEFIQGMPRGFSTLIGDRGFKLSGGECQRLSIARAMLKNSPILILDEATSHLDSKSEQLIKDALYALMQGKTTFIIAHRLSTVQKADKIVVLDKGKVAEVGDHTALIARDSLYKHLYQLQFSA